MACTASSTRGTKCPQRRSLTPESAQKALCSDTWWYFGMSFARRRSGVRIPSSPRILNRKPLPALHPFPTRAGVRPGAYFLYVRTIRSDIDVREAPVYDDQRNATGPDRAPLRSRWGTASGIGDWSCVVWGQAWAGNMGWEPSRRELPCPRCTATNCVARGHNLCSTRAVGVGMGRRRAAAVGPAWPGYTDTYPVATARRRQPAHAPLCLLVSGALGRLIPGKVLVM